MGVNRIKMEDPAQITTNYGPTPATYVDYFVDSTTGTPSYRGSDGVAHTLVGATGTVAYGTSVVADRTTGLAEYALPYAAAVAGATKTYVLGDRGKTYRRSNSGAAMTDTLPTMAAGDNGWYLKIENTDTTVASVITVTAPGGQLFEGSGTATFLLRYGCRQTFVWTGSAWRFDAGNANLIRTASTSVAGEFPTYVDTDGRVTVSSGVKASVLKNRALFEVNIVDYGADMTGATASDAALDAAIAVFPSGGRVMIPPGTLLLNNTPYIVSANNMEIVGASDNLTVIKTTSTTGNQLRLTGYGCTIRGVSIQGPGSGTTSSKTAGIGLDVQSVEGRVTDCSFAYQYDAMQIAGTLVDVEGIYVRYFAHSGIVVNQNSDHRISRVTMVNNGATLPTGSGIDVQVTASLVMDSLNIIASNFALNISPGAGVTVPSVKVTNSFFDTSAVGLRMVGAGAVFRSEFTNCWFSSMSVAGILIQPASGGNVDGITWVNCDLYNNVGGTTNGVLLGGSAGSIGKLKFNACTIAQWTNGINISAAGTSFFPQFIGNTIGAASAFTANGTGIVVATGTYKGLVIQGNDVVDNTTAMTLGTVTCTGSYQLYRVIDNPGLNARNIAVGPPAATPVLATTYTNTYGVRVQIVVKMGATANTGVTINGVANTVTFNAAAVDTFVLEPGGTILFTGGTAPTFWLWNAM